jgi:hypothetical protein
VDNLIDLGARELLGDEGPVAAEIWASGMLDAFETARRQARADGMEVPPFEEVLLHRCRQRRDRPAAVVAAAFAGVAAPPLEALAGNVAAELAGTVAGAPSWAKQVGQVTPTRAWAASDVFGDQDSLVVGFRHQAAPGEHALVVLVDHNLSGQAKDAFIANDYDDVITAWRLHPDPHMRAGEIPVDAALGRVRDAMATSDLWDGDSDLRTEEFGQFRALVWSRLRRCGLGEEPPSGPEVASSERAALVAEFMASREGASLAAAMPGTDVEILAHHLVDLRSDYEGRPLRWSPIVVGLLLGDLAPRKLLLGADEAAALPAVLRAYVRFSAQRTGLDQALVDEIVAAVDEMEPAFLDRIGDPAVAGPAKTVLAALQARGVDLGDLDALNEALEGSLPFKLPPPAPQARRRSAVAPVEVVSSAASALVLDRFDILADFYGQGRKLTQTGQPTLADARSLVKLLGTDDLLDQVIGDRTFRTRSAAELPELGFMVRWGLAAGALRKEHGKIRATTAWRKLDGKPLQRWTRAADALPSLGPLAAFHANARYRTRGEVLDELLAPVLHMLAAGKGAPFDEVLDRVCQEADATYEWLGGYMQDPEQRRRSFGWDLDRLASILGWAGVAERAGATVEPDRYGGERLVGGVLSLTPVGRWWLAET